MNLFSSKQQYILFSNERNYVKPRPQTVIKKRVIVATSYSVANLPLFACAYALSRSPWTSTPWQSSVVVGGNKQSPKLFRTFHFHCIKLASC